MKISVICVFNNREKYEKQLLSSLKHQSIDIEILGIDNTEGRFSSAAGALNYGASISKGDVLIFSHQDIVLKTKDELTRFADAIYSCETGSIIGTQGVRDKSEEYYTNLTSGPDYDPSVIKDYKNQLYEVSCVDEGLFGMKRQTWEEHHFDEKLCDNWHLYCVEACLYARKQGYSVYVYPAQLHHFSKGIITISYMMGLKKLCKHYRKEFKYIWTTCYKVRTNALYINALVSAWSINRFLRGGVKNLYG